MVGKNIRKFRESNGITQGQLAEKLNVTRQAVSNWETGKTQPDIDTLQNIAQLLEITVEELIYGTKREPQTIISNSTQKTVTAGISFGTALAMVISYATWKSIGWAIFHGLLNWFYVFYYIIKYGWS